MQAVSPCTPERGNCRRCDSNSAIGRTGSETRTTPSDTTANSVSERPKFHQTSRQFPAAATAFVEAGGP